MMLTTTSTKYRFMKIELAYVICQPFQPVVLLLSFHVAATGEDNQTDDPLLEIPFLYSASVGPPFHWCYIQHCLAITYSVQWEHNGTRSTENCMHLPPPAIVLSHTDMLTGHCTTYTLMNTFTGLEDCTCVHNHLIATVCFQKPAKMCSHHWSTLRNHDHH